MKRLAFLSFLLAVACGPSRAPVIVDRMDVTLTVVADGSLLVEERLSARFGADAVSTFRRHAPAWRHDGVSDVVATIDGRNCERGSGPGQVQVGGGPGLDVQWSFEPATPAAHVFGLTYRAANAVGLSGIRGTVFWSAVPAGRTFEVAEAAVTLTLPDGAVLLEDPWVEEPGWTVARLPRGMRATRASVPHGQSATIGIEFTADGLTAATPRWQADAALLEQLIPAFIAASLFILVVAAGVLWMVRLKYPRWRLTAGEGGELDLDRITPAMRVAVMRGRVGGDRALEEELVAAGLVDRERVRAARDLRRAGVAVALFGVAAWVFVAIAMRQFGAWSLAVPSSVVISGVMFIAGAARFDVLSAAGAAARVLYFARVLDGRTTA